MNHANNNYRFPILLAILLHAVLLLALMIHFIAAPAHLANLQPSSSIINATVVNQTSLQKLQPVIQPDVQPQPVKSKIEPVKKITTEAPSAALKTVAKQATEQQQLVKPAVSAQLDLKKQQQEKLVEHKRLVAEQLKQALAVEQKQDKTKKELAAKKMAEQVAQELMQSELAATNANKSEAKAVTSASSAQSSGEIDKYKTLIIQAISQQWIIPEDVKKNLEAKLLVTLAPGGMVLNVKIIQSSGDSVLDRSAETAVYKASPLPVPNDGALFNKFRTLNLIVRPEGILTGG